jgi:large subunit ribosomal protein L21
MHSNLPAIGRCLRVICGKVKIGEIMFYAVLENGGKQYKAFEGEKLEVDLLPVEIGSKKTFENVLLLVNDDDTQVGSPYLDGVSVDCTVVEHFKGEKLTIFKYRAKQRFRVKTGHRQKYTRVIVDSIVFPGKLKASKESEAVEEKDAAPVKKGRTKTASTSRKPAAKPAAKKTTVAKKTTAVKSEPAKKSATTKKKSS